MTADAPDRSVGAPRGAPVHQRVVLVSNSTAQFHSRAERFAQACADRGHEVTIVALWRPGLARDELDRDGVRKIRLEVRSLDGLPLGGLIRRVLPGLETRTEPGRGDAWELPGRSSAQRSDAAGPSRSPSGGRSAGAPAGDRREPPRRRIDWLVGRARLPLAIRAQARLALDAAPAADIHIGMAFASIPVALALARRDGSRAIYDVSDIYLEARNLARIRGPLRTWLRRTERGWARDSAAMTTANEPYADLIEDRLGAGRPTVVLNTPPRYERPPVRPRRFHEALSLDPSTRVVLFHGGLTVERGIEQLVAAIRTVPDATLVLMGYGDLVPWIEAALADPTTAERVRLLPPVSPADLIPWVASADVVTMPIQPTTLNHRFTTPNRLFEAIAAGVPILASDMPGMAAVVREIDGGVLVDPTDPDAIAAGLRDLLGRDPAELDAMRERLLRVAHERYCWEVEQEGFLDLLGAITGRPW